MNQSSEDLTESIDDLTVTVRPAEGETVLPAGAESIISKEKPKPLREWAQNNSPPKYGKRVKVLPWTWLNNAMFTFRSDYRQDEGYYDEIEAPKYASLAIDYALNVVMPKSNDFQDYRKHVWNDIRRFRAERHESVLGPRSWSDPYEPKLVDGADHNG